MVRPRESPEGTREPGSGSKRRKACRPRREKQQQAPTASSSSSAICLVKENR